MSILKKIWGIALLACMLIVAAPNSSKAQGGYVSDQIFYDELSPYGTWVYDAQYGNVWVPDVPGNFRPYATRGHWVLTDYGNTWVSDYPWGWAPFHYGRWVFDDFYGWMWVPGYEWAPAWVSWRQTSGYYGWAPLTPNISIDISFGNNYTIPDSYWVFAPQNYITSPVIYNYYVPQTRVVNIIRNTTIINNFYSRDSRRYIAGPRVDDIQRVTKVRPQIYNINNVNRPGRININNKTVNIYRPEVKRAPDARPARVVDASAYKKENPNARIGRQDKGGPGYNRQNASKLADVAKSANPNNNVVRVNSDKQPERNNRTDRIRGGRPEDRPNIAPQRNAPSTAAGQNRPDRGGQNGGVNNNGRNNRPDNAGLQQQEQQRQQRVQQQDAMRQQREAQRQQQTMQDQQQNSQRQQQREAQRQQFDQQQQQMRRQQQDAQRQQQQDVQRQQRDQERQMQRQQQDAQRQQEQQAQRQQQQDMQRQQRDQERQMQRQQQDMQRQQQQMQQQQGPQGGPPQGGPQRERGRRQ